MEDEKVTGTVKTEEEVSKNEEVKKDEKTFTRDEFNSAIAGEKKRLREEIKKELLSEQEAKDTEAKKLAKMDDDQKNQYNYEKSEKARQEAEAKLNAYELKEKARDIATEKNMDTSLLNVLDFATETAESISTKIDVLNDAFKKAVEKAINEQLKEKAPIQKNGDEMSESSSKPKLNNRFQKL